MNLFSRFADWLVMTPLVDWLMRPLEKLQQRRTFILLKNAWGLSDAEARSMLD